MTDMTNHMIPTPGDLRVCVIAAPGHMVAMPARDAKEADDIRIFHTASVTVARTHGHGGSFPTDAYIQRFNGAVWINVPTVADSTPWRVVTVDGVFRFATKEMAETFAAPGEVIEFAPDAELVQH